MPPKLADHTRIEFVQVNPKRAGGQAHARYEQYKSAKTVEDALKLNAKRDDIKHDIKAGYCTVLSEPGISADAASSDKRSGGHKRSAADVAGENPGPVAKRPEVSKAASVAAEAANEKSKASNAAHAGTPAAADAAPRVAVAALQVAEVAVAAPQLAVGAPQVAEVAAAAPQLAVGAPQIAEVAVAAPQLAVGAPQIAEVAVAAPQVAVAAPQEGAAAAKPCGSHEVQNSVAADVAPHAAASSSQEVAEAKPCGSDEKAKVNSVESELQAVPKPRCDEVDFSKATFEGKEMKFIKRSMGEAKKLLSQKGLDEAKTSGYKFTLLDQQSLSKWHVQLSDLNPDGSLAKGLATHNLDNCIDLEISLPDGYPMAPPFVRVLYPHLAGGFVFSHGAICFEALTAKGWVPSMSLPALAIAIKGIFDFGDVRVQGPGDRKTRTVSSYSEEGARRMAQGISRAHNDGESNTYGSLNRYKS